MNKSVPFQNYDVAVIGGGLSGCMAATVNHPLSQIDILQLQQKLKAYDALI